MAGPLKPKYSDAWVVADQTEDSLVSEQNSTVAEKLSIKKKQEKQRKLHRRKSEMVEHTVEIEEIPSVAQYDQTEFEARIEPTSTTMDNKPKSIKKDHHTIVHKEIPKEDVGIKISSSHKKGKTVNPQALKRNRLRLMDDSKSDQNLTKESQDLSRKSYLGLIEDMPLKVVTEDEWEGATTNAIMPSTLPGAAVKIFALSKGTYSEVSSMTPNEAQNDMQLEDMVSFPYGSPSSRPDYGNDTPLQLAIMMQKGCQLIYTMCHGFMGGISLAYVLLAFSIGTSFDEIGGFLQVYPPFAKCIQTSFGFLLSICLVSVLDRYDVRSWNRNNFQDILRSKSSLIGAVILLIYSSTLVLNTCAAPWDERLGLPPYNNSFWFTPETVEREINQWKLLSLFRCMGAIIGWILVTLFPNKDLLHARLHTIYGTKDKSSIQENKSRLAENKF